VVLVQQYSSVPAYLLGIYLIFSLYWVSQVIKNVVHVTVSGTVATWYFMHGTVGVPPNPTLQSFKRATTTSFGSICFGSLITSILRTLRVIFSATRRSNSNNIFIVILAVVAECVVAVLDWLIEYFNMYAFAQVAIYGKTYCEAAKATWRLVNGHGIKAIINDDLIGNVLMLACLIGGVLTAVLGGVMIYFLEHDYYIQMAIIGFIIGVVMVMMTQEVVESAVVAIFVCFAEEPKALQKNNPRLYNRFIHTYNISWV
jgi:hypothetical protein